MRVRHTACADQCPVDTAWLATVQKTQTACTAAAATETEHAVSTMYSHITDSTVISSSAANVAMNCSAAVSLVCRAEHTK